MVFFKKKKKKKNEIERNITAFGGNIEMIIKGNERIIKSWTIPIIRR